MTATTMLTWTRPWHPAGSVGHIYPDCERLLPNIPEPQGGPGRLDPHGHNVCRACAERHNGGRWDAECRTCDTSIADEWDDEPPYSEDDAKRWMHEHTCQPSTVLIPPPARPKPQPTPGQLALNFKEAA